MTASALVRGAPGSRIVGKVWLVQLEGKRGQPTPTVMVDARIRGLVPGRHGFHIHENASCQAPFRSAGGHFDPGPAGNSDPDANHPYHLGDLPNLRVNAQGVGRLEHPTTRITLSEGPTSIFDSNGSAIVVHLNEDQGITGPSGSGVSGGPRVACGVIKRDGEPEEEEDRKVAVNSTVDQVDATPGDGTCETAAGGGECTLRAAIQETNALAGPNEVTVPAGTYGLTLGELYVDDTVAIIGTGAAETIVNGAFGGVPGRILEIAPPPPGAADATSVRLSGVTVQAGAGVAVVGQGGAILNAATLTLDHSVIRNSRSEGAGGGIASTGPAARLTLTNSVVTGNSALAPDFRSGLGGGIYAVNSAALTIINSVITENRSSSGGGVFARGLATPAVFD
ncbi:MAG: superoxide dismutase family protein, partial [Actinobacteria bacterium]|nr:superoxide dismutase family protein [Actinomycetota bacterium]